MRPGNLWNLITLAAGLAGLAVLLWQVQLRDFVRLFHQVRPGWLALAVATGLGITAARATRFAGYFDPGSRGIFLYGCFAIMRAANYALPFKSGEVVFLGMLKARRFVPTIAEAVPIWLLVRVTDLAALLICSSLILQLHLASGALPETLYRVQLPGWSVTLLLISLTLTAPWWVSRVRVPTRFATYVSSLQSGLRRVSIAGLLRSLGWGLVIWLGMIAFQTTLLTALGCSFEWSTCALISCAVLLVSLLPIHPPLGVGTEELVWTGMLVAAGMELASAITLAIGIRALSVCFLVIETTVGWAVLLADSRTTHVPQGSRGNEMVA